MSDTPKSGAGWMKIVLGLSLAANLFFLGLMGGKLFGHKAEGRDDAPNSFMQSLSTERAAEVKAYFAAMKEDRKASRQKTRDAWAGVRKAMTADPYDRDALEAALQVVIGARTERSQVRYGKMADFVSDMTIEERTAFSDAMRERWKRRRARREQRQGN